MQLPIRTPCRDRSARPLFGLVVFLSLFHPASSLHPIVGNLARGSMLRISADLSGGNSPPPLRTAVEPLLATVSYCFLDQTGLLPTGLPLDHWKTRSVRFPNESPLESFKAIWVLTSPDHLEGSQRVFLV